MKRIIKTLKRKKYLGLYGAVIHAKYIRLDENVIINTNDVLFIKGTNIPILYVRNDYSFVLITNNGNDYILKRDIKKLTFTNVPT